MVLIVSNAPSLDQLRHVEAIEAPHVDARAFRQGWRVTTRLDALLDGQRITPGQWQAGVELRDAWGRVLGLRAVDPAGVRAAGADAAHDRMTTLLDTATRLRLVEARIGVMPFALCRWCAVEDRPWREIGRKLHRNHEVARDWTIASLRLLAGAWAVRRGGALSVSSEPGTPRRRVRAS